MTGPFDFFEVCRRFNRDPEATSLHAAECLYYGLDPQTTSLHALECCKFGLDPTVTSANALTAAGSRLYSGVMA